MNKFIFFVLVFVVACGDEPYSSVPEENAEEVKEDCVLDPCSCVHSVKYENWDTGREIGVFTDNVVIDGVPELLTARDKRTFRRLSYDACMYGYRDPYKGYSMDMTLRNETVIKSLSWPPLVDWLESF